MTSSWVLIAGLISGAAAQTVPASDVSITSVGMQAVTSASVGPDNGAENADLDMMVGQRLRWTLGEGGLTSRALVDARFTIDPQAGFNNDAQNFEVHNVRQLGVELHNSSVTFDVGRHPVFRGGPRLVDGIQALVRPNETVDVGVWAGLAPSLFDTDFRLRPGAGPILAWTGSRAQASLVGEVLLFDGALDRAGVLAMGRMSTNRLFEVSSRLDLQLASADGGPRLSDAQLYAIFAPAAGVRLDALYNAFSSYQYISSADLDPEQQRFDLRLQEIEGVNIEDVQQDPSVNHLLGASVRLEADPDGASPRFEVMTRYRESPEPEDRYLRLSPTVGVVRVGDRLDLLLNANWFKVEETAQTDVGLMTYLDVTDTVAIDTSLRALSVPDDYDGLGWYADFYLDVVAPEADLLLHTGIGLITEPDLDQADGEYNLFVRLSKYLRPRR